MSSKHLCLSRRAALQSGLVGGLVLAFQWPLHAAPVNERGQSLDHPDSQFVANAFIRIDKSGKTTLVIPQAEMGQGIYTAIAMIIAEELDADLAQVVLEHAPPSDKLYGNPIFGVQVTGNSNSIRAFWDKLRNAGAAARTMLIAAAAAQWQVEAASCSSSNGKITHAASNRTLTYGELADVAGKLPVPEKPKLKNPNDFTLIGKPLKRFDTPNKSDGKTIYGIDVIVPDMKFATLAQCPVLGGKVRHVEAGAAKKLPGVQQIVVLHDLVAVVGDHMWAAWQGLNALKVTWDEGQNANINSADVWNELRAASQKDGVVAKSEGDVDKGLTQGERTADKDTGIGNYSDQDFLDAVQRGVRKDGARLYPAMPYNSYTFMTDADVLAIKAYLLGLPAVPRQNQRDTLEFPFNQRWLMIFWSWAFNPNTRFAPNTEKRAEWNRGAYIAEALAHCGDCHTPRNLAFALNNRRKFAGAVAAGWRAYDITSDKGRGIGSWSDGRSSTISPKVTPWGAARRPGPWARRSTTALTRWIRRISGRSWLICGAFPRLPHPNRQRSRRRHPHRRKRAAQSPRRSVARSSRRPVSVAIAGLA